MSEELVLSQLEFEYLTQIKQRINLLNIRELTPQTTQDELRGNTQHLLLEELKSTQNILDETRKDCEYLYGLTEQLVTLKAKCNNDSEMIRKLTEEIQRFEDESHGIVANNKLLQVDLMNNVG
jgi:hypothetical protein